MIYSTYFNQSNVQINYDNNYDNNNNNNYDNFLFAKAIRKQNKQNTYMAVSLNTLDFYSTYRVLHTLLLFSFSSSFSQTTTYNLQLYFGMWLFPFSLFFFLIYLVLESIIPSNI